MAWTLSPGISFCETAGRFIFLDVSRDRYLCLAEETELSFRRLVAAAPPAAMDESILAGLAEEGLLRRSKCDSVPRPCVTVPLAERSLVDEAELPVPLRELGHGMWRLVQTTVAFRVFSLRALLKSVSCRKRRLQGSVPGDQRRLGDAAASFRKIGLFATPLDHCLPRSLALMHALLDRNIDAQMVIAVRLRPFGAHCWIQSGTTLLNESLDEVRNFTPILVL